MMHRCSNMVMGQCSCGLYHQNQNNNNHHSLSMFLPNYPNNDNEITDYYPSSYSSSVDCTLSLGTPSTRSSTQDDSSKKSSGFCWDFLSKASPYGSSQSQNSSNRLPNSRGGGAGSGNSNNDPLVARRCANCDTTSTPLWRNGPRGPKSLCNACGIRFKKEERRASAANSNGSASGVMDPHYYQTQQRIPCNYSSPNEFRFIDDNHHDRIIRESDSNIPNFLSSWRFNVTDRPTSLVHDFTR